MKIQEYTQPFIDPKIKSIELSYIMDYVVSITWNNDERMSIIRFNKKAEALHYIQWFKSN